MDNFYKFLKELEAKAEKQLKSEEDARFQKEMKNVANQLKVMKEELIKAGFESEFVDAMILELIKTQRGI